MYTNICIIFSNKTYCHIFFNVNISVQFVEKNAHTLQIINTEFETTASSPLDSSFKQFSKHDSYEYLF